MFITTYYIICVVKSRWYSIKLIDLIGMYVVSRLIWRVMLFCFRRREAPKYPNIFSDSWKNRRITWDEIVFFIPPTCFPSLCVVFFKIDSRSSRSEWPSLCPLGRVWLVQLIADRNSTFWKCRLHPANPKSLNRKFRFGIKIPLKPVNAADVFIILCHFLHFEF